MKNKNQNKKKEYICKVCGKHFIGWSRLDNRKKYCSIKCRQHAKYRIIKKCKLCNKEFLAMHDSKSRNQPYCSKQCAWKAQIGKPLTENQLKCLELGRGKKSEATKIKIGLAHKGKAHLSMRGRPSYFRGITGERHPLWRGGSEVLDRSIRHCFQYRQWRSDVFTRDNFTCVICGGKGGDINAHHYPKAFITIFRENKITSLEEALKCEEFWNINNGITLCEDCHKKQHKIYGKEFNLSPTIQECTNGCK